MVFRDIRFKRALIPIPISLKESEVRIDFLRKKSTKHAASEAATSADSEAPSSSTEGQHVDLFADFQDKMKKVKPMDEEKRLEQEKYEKQIGYLTYLGQDTNEAAGTRNWYDVAPKRQDEFDETNSRIEVGLRTKLLHDPMARFLKQPLFESKPTAEKKKPEAQDDRPSLAASEDPKVEEVEEKPSRRHKKEKKSHRNKHKKRKHRSRRSSESSGSNDEDELEKIKMEKLRILREARLQREKAEKSRTEEFLIQKFPQLAPPPPPPEKKREPTERPVPFVKQKYNSQFNPYLAKQNYN